MPDDFEVQIAGNRFVNTPVILQFEDTLLIEVIKEFEPAGYTTQFSIYSQTGIPLAKVKGTQIYRTPHGKDAGLTLEYPDQATACKLDGEIVFELWRDKAAYLKASARLYTPFPGSF
jgi:hypothetical protein